MNRDRYKKVVYWSDEDECFIGICPELMYGGVHGDDPVEVFKELGEAVDETIEILLADGKPLPEPKNSVLVETI
ncbi:MAG: type II toxin-antitoxin system HicB family antitoxin [Pyrinomonadaceae bacterium]